MAIFSSINGRSIMAMVLLVLDGTNRIASSAPCDPNPSGDPYTINNYVTSSDLDALIIGSGWAGIAAAYEIERYNSHVLLASDNIRYTVLEAADYIGGRAIAAKWLAGCEGNPITELASEYFSQNKNSPSYLNYQAQDWEDIEYWCLKRNNAQECSNQYVKKHTDKWYEAYYCVEEKALSMDPNDETSVRDTLTTCGWENGKEYEEGKGLLPNILEYYDIWMEFVQEPQYISTREGFPLGPHQIFQDKDCFISDPEFTAKILREVVAKESIPVETNMQVCKVDWNGPDGNKVIACAGGDSADCTEYTVPKVISTLSEGVMDVKGDDIFDPTISSQTNYAGTSKLQAMRNVFQSTYAHGAADPLVDDTVEGMTDFKEIRVQFDEKFWGDSQFIFIETEERGQCNVWQSYETRWSNKGGANGGEFFPGSHTLVCVLTTEDYRAFKADTTRSTEDKVRDLIQNSLGKVYGPGGPQEVNGWNEYIDDSSRACVQAPLPSSSPSVYPFELANPPKPDFCKEKPNDSLCSSPYWDKDDPDRRCRFEMFDEDNDLWYGSYVNWKPEGTKEDFDFFIEPLSIHDERAINRTHFAGSATCYTQWAYTHGAWWSGLDASQHVIRELRREHKGADKDFPSEFALSQHFCDADPSVGGGNLRKARGRGW